MRLPIYRLRTLMITIAFVALILTVFMQFVQLRRAAVREEYLRAEAAQQRAEAEQQRELAEANLQRARAAVDQMLEQVKQR
jgi:F0F1-type ATP synthase membrane subunit b/b'